MAKQPHRSRNDQPPAVRDPFDSVETLASMARVINPTRLARQALEFQRELWSISVGDSERDPDPRDWRFQDPAWTHNPSARRLVQTYLAWADALAGTVDEDADDWRDVQRAKFGIELLTAAAAPTNQLFSNPAALKEMIDTGGESVLRGFRNWADDLLRNGGMPGQVDRTRFEVGKDLAVTPGAVVFRSDLLELIQYQPSTATVRARPTLLVPPQINKYYFLDLAPGRSLTEYAVSRGIPFFTISWRNPGPEHADWTLDTYIEAALEAIDAVCEITGSDDLLTLGICAGGITTTAMLAYQTTVGDHRVAATSFSVMQIDWEEPTMMGMFAHPTMGPLAKSISERRGILPGENLAQVFSWLRPNELVWNYWVNNYLMGKKPPAFDVLFWNADSTNLPAGLHGDFIDLFNDNLLAKGAFSVLGKPIDLRTIELDHFVSAGINDHITPWRGGYRTTQLLGGQSEFVLSQAGHIASVVNPPGNPKAHYYAGPDPGPDPDAWLRGAERRAGTWWERWADWTCERSGDEVPAPQELGSSRYPVLDEAPGRYVLEPA
ncbi:MAG: alpha/beta fold hydrolase [Myxococcales bacterium]|nr:alpha/beta fold hydrolase [Myxococcales bacterium]